MVSFEVFRVQIMKFPPTEGNCKDQTTEEPREELPAKAKKKKGNRKDLLSYLSSKQQ